MTRRGLLLALSALVAVPVMAAVGRPLPISLWLARLQTIDRDENIELLRLNDMGYPVRADCPYHEQLGWVHQRTVRCEHCDPGLRLDA